MCSCRTCIEGSLPVLRDKHGGGEMRGGKQEEGGITSSPDGDLDCGAQPRSRFEPFLPSQPSSSSVPAVERKTTRFYRPRGSDDAPCPRPSPPPTRRDPPTAPLPPPPLFPRERAERVSLAKPIRPKPPSRSLSMSSPPSRQLRPPLPRRVRFVPDFRTSPSPGPSPSPTRTRRSDQVVVRRLDTNARGGHLRSRDWSEHGPSDGGRSWGRERRGGRED